MAVFFNDFLDVFSSKVLAERELSNTTVRYYQLKLNQIRNHLGHYPVNKIKTADISDFLFKYPPRSSNQYRTFLGDIFKHAVGMGHCDHNPAVSTIARNHKKARQRMTLQGFDAIYSCAPQWLKNAMDVAIQTLQRRTDIAVMRFSDIKDGHLKVIQEKTKRHGASAHLEIEILPPLSDVISRCRDSILSPFIIHRLPDRLAEQNIRLNNREHITQILPDYITKAFNKAREESGFYADIHIDNRPTFHEIRSLGAALYKRCGINPQALLGHKSPNDSTMTDYYLAGHQIWTRTKAGVNLDFYRLSGR